MSARKTVPSLMAALALAAIVRADTVERRGIEGAVQGQISLVDDAGVRMRSDLGADLLIPWDRVRRVVADRSIPNLDQRMKTATALWRARTRVERGDIMLAEPLFDRLFEQYRGQASGTALVVAEGLLRCRLHRGAHETALIPALEVARLKRAGITTVSFSMLPPAIDEQTLLPPVLAPVWIATSSLGALHRELKSYDAGGDVVINALRTLYLQSVSRALGREVADVPDRLPDHRGVEVLSMLLSCEANDVQDRRTAVSRLKRALPGLPEWVRAWARYQLGVSMLLENQEEDRQRGLVQLAHIPARYGWRQAYLSGMALARMSDELARQGDEDGAARVLAELARRYPDHPLQLTQTTHTTD